MLLGLAGIMDCPGASVDFSVSVDLRDLLYGNCYPVSEPVKASGTVNITMNGDLRDWNCATIMR